MDVYEFLQKVKKYTSENSQDEGFKGGIKSTEYHFKKNGIEYRGSDYDEGYDMTARISGEVAARFVSCGDIEIKYSERLVDRICDMIDADEKANDYCRTGRVVDLPGMDEALHNHKRMTGKCE